MELPFIRPPMRVPDVNMEPHGYIIGPIPFVGPMAMVMNIRLDTGERCTGFIAAEYLFPHVNDEGSLDILAVDQDQFALITAVGWPSEWASEGGGWILVHAMAEGLLQGYSWAEVRQMIEDGIISHRTAPLN